MMNLCMLINTLDSRLALLSIINDYYSYCSLTLDSGSKSGRSGACFNRNTVDCTGDSMDVVEKVYSYN